MANGCSSTLVVMFIVTMYMYGVGCVEHTRTGTRAAAPAMEFALQDDAAFPGWLNIDMNSRTVTIIADHQILAFQRAAELGIQRIRTMSYIRHPCTPELIRNATIQRT